MTATNSVRQRAAAHRRTRCDSARVERSAGASRSRSRARSINDQIHHLRSILFWSFLALGIGLLVLAALQTVYGLWPLRRVRREVAAIRSGEKTRISDDFPTEIRPLTEEINQLLAHSEEQAEEARRHAGNLAHALKTPLTVITNAATRRFARPRRHRVREAAAMRRQIDHHLARARALGRRSSAQARARSGTAWKPCSAPSTASTRTSPSTSPATVAHRYASSARTSTR